MEQIFQGKGISCTRQGLCKSVDCFKNKKVFRMAGEGLMNDGSNFWQFKCVQVVRMIWWFPQGVIVRIKLLFGSCEL